MHVWAMETSGEFALRRPAGESFSQLNAVYDREVTPRLKEGVFLDRQTFLLSRPTTATTSGPRRRARRRRRRVALPFLERLRRRADDWTELRALGPAQDDGRRGPRQPLPEAARRRGRDVHTAPINGWRSCSESRAARRCCPIAFLWVLLPTWIYVDARERGVRRAPLFAFLTVISSLVGLVVYLIARPEQPHRLACPGCAREVNGGAFCPHCGRDLSSSFCPTCRYPLKPDWAFCPACRTEIKARGPRTRRSPTAG